MISTVGQSRRQETTFLKMRKTRARFRQEKHWPSTETSGFTFLEVIIHGALPSVGGKKV
jgi:hypothetical protein